MPPTKTWLTRAPPAGLHPDAAAGFNFDVKVVTLERAHPNEWRGLVDVDTSDWPPRGERFKAISSGPLFTCALRLDGTPVCWGESYDTPLPPDITYESVADERYTDIASGYSHACALRPDGTTVCWATATSRSYGRLLPPAGARFTTIVAGLDHTCGLRADGSAACWGQDLNRISFPPGGEKAEPPGGQAQSNGHEGRDDAGSPALIVGGVDHALDPALHRLGAATGQGTPDHAEAVEAA